MCTLLHVGTHHTQSRSKSPGSQTTSAVLSCSSSQRTVGVALLAPAAPGAAGGGGCALGLAAAGCAAVCRVAGGCTEFEHSA